MALSDYRKLCHWGPITVLCIIKLITWAMVHMQGMWWPPEESFGGTVHATLYLSLAGMTLFCFLQAVMEGPGFAPRFWTPETEPEAHFLQYCTACQTFKPPRSHHCRTCGFCVLKMDHHCPWINTCVGYNNQGYFIAFLAFAVLGSLQASISLSICFYHAIYRVWYIYQGIYGSPRVFLTLTTLPLVLLAIGMAFGVVLAVGALLIFQTKCIILNRTTIEFWIVQKAEARRRELGLPRFVFPYDLGPRRNIAEFFSKGDGIDWPLKDGCAMYDLTLEQLDQKDWKRERSRPFVCVAAYSGRWFPVWAYPHAALCMPYSSEPRLQLAVHEVGVVTRHRKHWVYGEKQPPEGKERGERGWFPRASIVYGYMVD